MNPLRRTIQQKRSIALLKLDECGTYAAITDASSVRQDQCVDESIAGDPMVALQRAVQAFIHCRYFCERT